MKPYYQDNSIKIYNSDCRDMSELTDGSIQCVVTSPPYWGLRKYSGGQELIWGDKDCDHKWGALLPCHHPGQVTDAKAVHNETTAGQTAPSGQFCSLCGAWKGAYGLEPTPEMYIEHTILILREIRRVLRKDGVVFWNIGDSYYGSGQGASSNPEVIANAKEVYNIGKKHDKTSDILKPKDLCLIPFRVAIACQEDGWWVRSVIIWSKPNPMPESCTDRPTESHEYILMLTKSKNYYWDADAVRESGSGRNWAQAGGNLMGKGVHKLNEGFVDIGDRTDRDDGYGRNIRTVWEFPTQPYPEAHFAVFPEKLPELCIKAATPEVGCCSKCGAPWERIIEDTPSYWDLHKEERFASGKGENRDRHDNYTLSGPALRKHKLENPSRLLGWQPTCKCNADKVPSIILDPFMGAGTVAWVAKKLGRRAVGYEISEEYCKLSLERNRQQVLEM